MKRLFTAIPAMILILSVQGCTYNYPQNSTAANTQQKQSLAPVLPGMSRELPIGVAPAEPVPPKEIIMGSPHYPGQGASAVPIGGPKGLPGSQAQPGQRKTEKSPFGANFWAYMAASIVIKCIPDCFK